MLTHDQSEELVKAITFPPAAFSFRKLLQLCDETELTQIAENFRNLDGNKMERQNYTDLINRILECDDINFVKGLKEIEVPSNFHINNLLQILSPASQTKLISILIIFCRISVQVHKKDDSPSIEPRGRKRVRLVN